MNFRTLSLVIAVAIVGLPGCQRKPVATDEVPPTPLADPMTKTRTRDGARLRAAVDDYAVAQNPENDAAVRQAMADVDTEMAGLEDLVAKRHGRDRQKVAAKLRHLEVYRSEQTTRFAEIQAGTALGAPNPREGPTGKVELTPKPAGSASEGEARNAGDAVKNAGR